MIIITNGQIEETAKWREKFQLNPLMIFNKIGSYSFFFLKKKITSHIVFL
jgi:hypothetical protein